MKHKLEKYLTLLTLPDGEVKVKTSVFIDIVACSLKQVEERNPYSPLYFFFDKEDIHLEKDNDTFVCKVLLIYSSSTDEKKLGDIIFTEIKDALKISFPNIQFRIIVSGKRV